MIEMTQRVINFCMLMPRRIKRYDNRKLYDTEASEYVALSDVADMVRAGETVQIVDNSTGEDLTAQTLMQILLEEGKSGNSLLPSEMLHDVLRQSSRAIDSGFEQLRQRIDGFVDRSVGQLNRLVQHPRARELEELRAQLQELETQLAELIQAAKQHNAQTSRDDPSAEA